MSKRTAKRTTVKAPPRRPGTREDVQDLLDLFCCAVGEGAQMRIKRKAIRLVRLKFNFSLDQMVEDPNWQNAWKEDGANALEYMKTIGRLAAQLALASGTPHIDQHVMAAAMETVIKAVTDDYTALGRPCMGVTS